jgi:anti-sigma factor RsiW
MIPPQIREQLPIYADGELPREQRAEVERHLTASPELRAELERWQALRACCRRVIAREPLPPGLDLRLAEQMTASRSALRGGRTYRLFAGVTALAAAIAARPANPGGGTVVASVTASQFADIHRHCALDRHDDQFHKRGADPNVARVELAAAQGYRLLMPDLSREGYVLDGVCPCFPEKGVKASASRAYAARSCRRSARTTWRSTRMWCWSSGTRVPTATPSSAA